MKIAAKPEDNNKVIGLVVGVVLVFGFVIFRTVSALGGSGAEPPPVEGVVKSPNGDVKVNMGGGGAVVAGNSNASTDDATIVVKTFPPGSTPNPFHKAISDTIRDRKNGVRPTGKGVLPPSGGDQPVLVEGPPPPVLSVMGVNMGRHPIVVMQVDGKTFIVDKGAMFSRGLRVKDVSATQVVIDDGRQLHYIRVGAPTAPSAPATPDGSKPPTKDMLPTADNKKLTGSI